MNETSASAQSLSCSTWHPRSSRAFCGSRPGSLSSHLDQLREHSVAVEFSATARRLGIFSAVGVVVLGVAYAVTLAVGLLSLKSPQQPIGDPMFSILEVLIIVMMPVNRCDRTRRTRSASSRY